MDIKQLTADWQAAKKAETEATSRRREIEDKLIEHYKIGPENEGVIDCDNFKVTCRMTRKVDGDKVQELAREAGLTEHLSTLFRWSPSINMTLWKASNPKITQPLEAAITVKPGRPSFKLKD